MKKYLCATHKDANYVGVMVDDIESAVCTICLTQAHSDDQAKPTSDSVEVKCKEKTSNS